MRKQGAIRGRERGRGKPIKKERVTKGTREGGREREKRKGGRERKREGGRKRERTVGLITLIGFLRLTVLSAILINHRNRTDRERGRERKREEEGKAREGDDEVRRERKRGRQGGGMMERAAHLTVKH